jgi:hypothetical protein
MKIASRSIAAGLLSAAGVAVVLAQAPALDVKMGLWEMTTSSDVGGQMPAIDTSKMTPEQRASVEAAMKGMMGVHTNVTKTCMTKEKFDRSSFMATDEPGRPCKQTITTNTRSILEGTMSCSGARPMTGQMHIDALSSTNIKATIKSSETDQGKTMNVNVAMTGKWLGADCGTVKP